MLHQHLERLRAHCDPVLLRTHCALDETLREGSSAVRGQGRVTEVRQPVTKHRFRQTAEHREENMAARGRGAEEEAEGVLSEGCNFQVETCITVSTTVRFLQSVVNEQRLHAGLELQPGPLEAELGSAGPSEHHHAPPCWHGSHIVEGRSDD